MMYEVDLGDHREIWSYKEIYSWWKYNGNHDEYPTFDIWWDDVKRHGLILEI